MRSNTLTRVSNNPGAVHMTSTSKPCTTRCLNLSLEDLTVLP